MGEERKVYKNLVRKSMERSQIGSRGIDDKMGSKWILGRLAGGCCVDSVGSA
jgi:hypothetical protein